MGMQTLNTTDGRQVKVIKAAIVVSTSPGCERGRFIDLRVIAILPGCRKAVLLSISPAPRYIWLKPLFGHNGSAQIHPTTWAEFVRGLPVTSCDLFPIEITPELAADAVEHELTICTCPAVTNA